MVVRDPSPQKPILQLNEWTSSVICAHKSSHWGRSDRCHTCGNCKHMHHSTSVLLPIKDYYGLKAESCCFCPTCSCMAEREMNASCDNLPISPRNRVRLWSPTAPCSRRLNCRGAPASPLWTWLQHTGTVTDQTELRPRLSNQRPQTLTK